jgi:hypothetical protein
MIAAIALAAALASLPYPAPRQLQPTKDTKCDMGTVLSVDAVKGEMKGTTPAGVVTYRVGPEALVFDKDGKLGSLAGLTVGARYRTYYLIDEGAKVQEIDLE